MLSIEEAFGDLRDPRSRAPVLRSITMNLLKCSTNTKAGLRIRRLKACADDTYRASLPGL
ncbi:hypothetical protein PQR64_35100 [Paraburkholderia phytofirmans]|uniref:hypothetical protein n=1 Tax=Paraburkholderia phytofirmans TaxID=261302 RepID=UPI0038B9EB26